RGNAAVGQDLLLLVAERAVVGVGRDRSAGRNRRLRGGLEDLALVVADLRRAGGDLDDAGPDSTLADPVGQLLDEQLGHRIGAVTEVAAESPVRHAAFVFLVET